MWPCNSTFNFHCVLYAHPNVRFLCVCIFVLCVKCLLSFLCLFVCACLFYVYVYLYFVCLCFVCLCLFCVITYLFVFSVCMSVCVCVNTQFWLPICAVQRRIIIFLGLHLLAFFLQLFNSAFSLKENMVHIEDGVSLSNLNFHYSKTNWKEINELMVEMNWKNIFKETEININILWVD